MTKRPPLDLLSLTTEQAVPMPEAVQRVPHAAPTSRPGLVKTENLEALAFKVPRAFRKRFKERAVHADLKLNELLFESLDAWEEKRGFKK